MFHSHLVSVEYIYYAERGLTDNRHMRTRDVEWDSVSDHFKFETADAEHLIPLEIDDSYITAEQVQQQPVGKVSLVSGFNALIRISVCLVSIVRDYSLPVLSFRTADAGHRDDLGTCPC
jgi:hypothetical protein